MTQEMMIMAAILVAVILLTLKYSWYTVRQVMTRSRRNCITVVLLLFGPLYKGMNFCL